MVVRINFPIIVEIIALFSCCISAEGLSKQLEDTLTALMYDLAQHSSLFLQTLKESHDFIFEDSLI